MNSTISTAFGPLYGSNSFEKQVKALIAASEERIARIESQIRDLECMRDREYGVLATLRLNIVPIRKLPDELLTDIFRRAVGNPWRYYLADRVRSALRVSQVCKHWRKLTHRTPALWTTQLPIIFKQNKPHSAEYIAMTEVYQERSAPLPISFHLNTGYNNEISPALADVLACAAPRWCNLSLTGNPSMLYAIAKLRPDAFKYLERVSLRVAKAPPLLNSVGSAFVCASRLREVTLKLDIAIEPFPMPWAQLTRLTLGGSKLQHTLDVLVQCTHLEQVRIETLADDGAAHPVDGIATLPHLRQLHITLSGTHVEPCFRRLALPKLEALNISHNGMTDDSRTWGQTGSATFSSFLRRSPNLEQLHDLLVHCPALVDLTLESCQFCINDRFLGALEYSQDDVVHLVPRLRSLSLSWIGGNFDEDNLLSTIRSRWWTPAALQALPAPPPVAVWGYVHVFRGEHVEGRFSVEFQNEVDALQSEGLDIDVE
ncbi:hypothetical protein R3P38DRAFT_3026760 [Favolaschia claudopus]|uniref:F-box domain-containing protein n=1 Tax=Favolaschia claudopus TaxID=2862362 RepID=A0AAW0AGF1_9AGAR